MKYSIPFFSLKRQWNKIEKSLLPKIQTLLQNNQFVGGPTVKQFEEEFASYTNANHAISCNSGTDALWLALKALDVQPNSIVLTTPFSFIASSSEIVAHKALPVFIDIDDTYNISPQTLEKWLSENTEIRDKKAFHKKNNSPIEGIITVDLFGQCADYKAIKNIAKKWNLWIIEDACQAVGASIDKQKTGTFGDIACFSLYPTKNLGVCGDGGVITTNDHKLAQNLIKLRNHGRRTHYEYECYGINSRLDAIQALVASEKLRILDNLNERRREIAHYYTQQLSKIPGIKTPKEMTGYHVYHQYCIQVEKRDVVKQYLENNNIGTNIFYPKALNEIPFLTPPKNLQTKCPNTILTVKNILALPIWPELTNEEVEYICTTIEQACSGKRN